ncbi:MAG: hypothetical protein ACI376_09140 [Candidatus Bruticola sp.]
MPKLHLHLLGIGLLGAALAGPLSLSAQAETVDSTDLSSPSASLNNTADNTKSLNNSTPAAQPSTHSLDELQQLFQKQQRLLEDQAKLIEKQQVQIDEMRSQIEEMRRGQFQTAATQGEGSFSERTAAAASMEEPKQTPNLADAPTDKLDREKEAALAESSPNENNSLNSSKKLNELEAQANPDDGETEDLGPEPPSASEAPQEATAQASGQQPDMNPNISLVLLGGGQLGGQEDSSTKNSFFIQEAELQLSAPVDPSTRLEATFAAHQNESPELEEAFIQYMGLSGGLQLRAGQMRTEFGALNSTHTHALPQIDRPLPYTEFLGEEGLSTPGVELSWLLPTPWYSKISTSVTSRIEGHSHNGEEAEEEFALFPNEGKHNPMFSARWENMAELNDDTTLTLGLSHASSSIDSEHIRSSSINGADLTLKWSPTADPYREFIWRSEYMQAHQSYQTNRTEEIEEMEEHEHHSMLKDKNLSGWYTYLAYRCNKNFRLGARYEEAESPLVEDGKTKRFSTFAEYIANEWNSIKLQYNRTSPSWQPSYNELLLQWNVVIGPHGAHKY